MRATSAVLFWGGLFGVVTSIVWIGHDLLVNLANLSVPSSNVLNNALTITLVLVFGATGVLAARATGDFETGAYAGLLASFIGMIVGAVTLLTITFLFMDTIRQSTIMVEAFKSSGASDITQFIIEDAVGGVIFGGLLSLALGGLCGAMGGLIGKMLASRAHA
jgi:thiamine transporter ThiT